MVGQNEWKLIELEECVQFTRTNNFHVMFRGCLPPLQKLITTHGWQFILYSRHDHHYGTLCLP